MHALREIGNYGAHMKERGGEILDVEAGDPEALLGLIEMLFADWYVPSAKRKERLERIVAMADAKKSAPEPELHHPDPATLRQAPARSCFSRFAARSCVWPGRSARVSSS